MRQSGDGLGQVWKGIKKRGPGILKDVVKETAIEGLKGLNSGGKGEKPNWKGALAGLKRGAIRSGKRKVSQEIQGVLGSRRKRRPVWIMIPIYSRCVRRLPGGIRTYKGGSIFQTRSKLPDYRWVQSALRGVRQKRRHRRG